MTRSLIQSSVLYRDLGRAYPTIVRGEGVYLWDAEGRRYIDGSGGSSAVTSIGHGVREIAEAMAAQAKKVAFVPMHMKLTPPRVLTRAQADEIVAILDAAIGAVEARL
jgi:adenosylmethionine-8-amino-7-oxononanoate aminotransferase